MSGRGRNIFLDILFIERNQAKKGREHFAVRIHYPVKRERGDVGLLARRHIVAGDFHYIGKEASTRWAGGPDPSMLADAGALDSADETCREYERVADAKYLDHIRTEAKQFSNKLLSRQSGVARCAIIDFKKGKNTIKPRTLRKLTKAIHHLQNKTMKNKEEEQRK
jgi:hypothetical protein